MWFLALFIGILLLGLGVWSIVKPEAYMIFTQSFQYKSNHDIESITRVTARVLGVIFVISGIFAVLFGINVALLYFKY